MGKKHYIYMNGQPGYIPDNLLLSFDVQGCVEEFDTLFSDSLYQSFNLAKAIEDGVIKADEVYAALENFFTDDDIEFSNLDWDAFIEKEFDGFLENGYVKRYVNDDVLEAIDKFGGLYVDRIVDDFRKSGHVSLGPEYGADYASWDECTCDAPWEHTEDTMAQWLYYNRDEWFTEYFEVKLRHEDDFASWEEIESFEAAVSVRDKDAVEAVILDNIDQESDRRRVVEVRWNWVDGAGAGQGHYFTPEYEEE